MGYTDIETKVTVTHARDTVGRAQKGDEAGDLLRAGAVARGDRGGANRVPGPLDRGRTGEVLQRRACGLRVLAGAGWRRARGGAAQQLDGRAELRAGVRG